jgi:hypothetical protein
MRGSIIWFALAIAWGVDAALALARHNHLQAALTALFACCFLVAALFFRKREQSLFRRQRHSSNKL